MALNRKIYVVGGQNYNANWMQGKIVEKMIDADLVVFTGGEDVDPSLYGTVKHPKTYSNLERDQFEKGEFDEALALGKPMIGICRGSQFLCVMAGGKLVQHQQNPAYIHSIHTNEEGFPMVAMTSTHHQAQLPYNLPNEEFKVLAWTVDAVGRRENGLQLPVLSGREVEIAYYNKINALGIQGHPEEMYGEAAHEHTINYVRILLDKLMEGKL